MTFLETYRPKAPILIKQNIGAIGGIVLGAAIYTLVDPIADHFHYRPITFDPLLLLYAVLLGGALGMRRDSKRNSNPEINEED